MYFFFHFSRFLLFDKNWFLLFIYKIISVSCWLSLITPPWQLLKSWLSMAGTAVSRLVPTKTANTLWRGAFDTVVKLWWRRLAREAPLRAFHHAWHLVIILFWGLLGIITFHLLATWLRLWCVFLCCWYLPDTWLHWLHVFVNCSHHQPTCLTPLTDW